MYIGINKFEFEIVFYVQFHNFYVQFSLPFIRILIAFFIIPIDICFGFIAPLFARALNKIKFFVIKAYVHKFVSYTATKKLYDKSVVANRQR